MARRSVTGQLNMFDFFGSTENQEVEMVSLMPNFEDEVMEEPEGVVEETPLQEADTPVMSRTYNKNGEKIEIAYINYNKVRITRGDSAPELIKFDNSKEAVDYYVEYMQKLEQ